MIVDPATVLRSIFCRLLVDAEAAGVMIPHGLEPSEVIVFYSDGRPVEAMASGTLPDGDAWVTDPAPRWTTKGRLLPEDDERPHSYARADGSWGNRRRTRAAMSAHQLLEDLAESTIDLPEDLQRVARLVLERLAGAGEENAGYALAEAGRGWRVRLAEGLKKRVADMRRATGMDAPWPGPADERGVTEAAAAWIAETFPNGGAESAEELRQRAKASPWAPWWPEDGEDFAFLLRRLTRLVWRNEVEAEAERARRNPPALVRLVAAEVNDVQTRQPSLPGLEERELRDRRGRIVATIDASVTDLPLVHEGLDALRSPVGNRLVKNLVLTAHRQAEVEEPLFNRVQYDGGWSGVADAVGHSGRDLRDLKALAKMGQHVNWQSRDGIYRGGGWWMVDEKRGGPGAPGHVRFTLADCFLPGFASALKRDSGHTLSERKARRLVPELPYEPPTGAVNERSRGAVWSLHRLFLLELVDRAEDLAKKGVVVVKKPRWEELAKVAGLPIGLLKKVQDSWTEGESEKAPKMVERDGDGWRLALDVYRLEHDFLVDSGQRRIDGQKGGRKGGEKE